MQCKTCFRYNRIWRTKIWIKKSLMKPGLNRKARRRKIKFESSHSATHCKIVQQNYKLANSIFVVSQKPQLNHEYGKRRHLRRYADAFHHSLSLKCYSISYVLAISIVMKKMINHLKWLFQSINGESLLFITAVSFLHLLF